MSDAAHFGRLLTLSKIRAVAWEHGFASLENVEKFLIDLEVLYHMRRAMPGCVVMGGLAVPFHLGRDAARLSIDVDVVAGLDAESSRLAMDRAFKDMDSTIRDAKPHKPRFPRKALPLNMYFCRYNSALDAEPREIKIDLFYGGRPGARTVHFRPPTTLLGAEVDFGVTTYDYSQMIADKLSTLAFGTIGLDAADPGVPKHIHDIASLIMSGGGGIDMSKIAAAFGRTSREESGYMQGSPPTDEKVRDSLRTFYRSLLVPSTGLKLGKAYGGRFAHFAANMLTRNRSRRQLHVTDVMLAGSLAGMVAGVLASEMTAKDATEAVNQIRTKLNKIAALSIPDRNKMARELRGAYDKKGLDYSLVKTMDPDQVYLYGFLPRPD